MNYCLQRFNKIKKKGVADIKFINKNKVFKQINQKRENLLNRGSLVFKERKSTKKRIIELLSIILALFIVYTAGFGGYTAVVQRAIPLLLASLIIFLNKPLRPPWNILDIVFILGTLFSMGYILLFYEQLAQRIGSETSFDYLVGIVGTVVTIEIARRTVGYGLPLITSIFLIYCCFGENLPGIFSHPNLSIGRVVRYTWLSQEGVFGVALGVMTSFVFIFILFGVFLEKTGAGGHFIDLSYSLTGTLKSGPALSAVVASAFFGTISGSSAANVVSTGSFTIPLMKKLGYSPKFAAAVEAAASSGGQLMPPMMGAAAFVMADIIGKPYLDIIKAAFIPAIIYFTTIGISVHLEASRLGLKGLPRDQLPKFRETLVKCSFYLLPIFVLVFMLIRGFSPGKAGFYAIVLLLITSLHDIENRNRFLSIIYDALVKATKVSLQLWAVVAVVGIVICSVTATGLGPNFAELVLRVSRESVFLALFITMVASIIMGMGLPTVACYILLAILVAPGLVRLGLLTIGSHMFVLYFGVMSSLTPPVAIAAFAAAGVAQTDPMKVGWASLRLALPAFLLPYMFIMMPELLMIGDTVNIILAILTGIVGGIILSIVSVGYFIRPVPLILRLILFVTCVMLIYGRGFIDIFALMILLVVFLFQRNQNNKKKKSKKEIIT